MQLINRNIIIKVQFYNFHYAVILLKIRSIITCSSSSLIFVRNQNCEPCVSPVGAYGVYKLNAIFVTIAFKKITFLHTMTGEISLKFF